jgi:glucose-1-phosphate adenylyltransferase
VIVNRKAELKKCVIDRNVVIPEGLVVGEDPVEDAKWFRVSEGGIVLITQDMLDARARLVVLTWGT